MVPVFRRLNACLGSQEKVPRIVEAGVHRRKGLPRPGKFRESFPGEACWSDLILYSSMETLNLGSFERTLVVVVEFQ